MQIWQRVNKIVLEKQAWDAHLIPAQYAAFFFFLHECDK